MSLKNVFIIREASNSFSHANPLWDHFSQEPGSYKSGIENALNQTLGKNWKKTIDKAFGKSGITDQIVQELWDGFWTDQEAYSELAAIFDFAQQGTLRQYDHIRPGKFGTQVNIGPGGRPVPRDHRATGPDDFGGGVGEEDEDEFADDVTPGVDDEIKF